MQKKERRAMSEKTTDFQQALDIADLQRRTTELEKDVNTIKPIVYETASSVKQIEKSVTKMEVNSDKIKGYFLAAAITAGVSGAVGIIFLALQTSIFGG